MAKVIFLDFDGVICTPRACVSMQEKGRFTRLDPVGLEFVRRLHTEFDASIVISSSWRLGWSNYQFQDLFGVCGFSDISNAMHKDWRTPELNGEPRGKEIEQWLSEHDDVKQYLILDDDSDMLTEQKPFLVKTDGYNGILYNHFFEAEEILA